MTFKNYMPYTEGEKRYHTLSYDLSHRFGGRVWKAAVDAGFTRGETASVFAPAAAEILLPRPF